MKKTCLLFFILSIMCVSLISGCGETKYEIHAFPENNEFGMVEGGGSYKEGETFTLRVYPNLGCEEEAPTLRFTKNGESTEQEIYLNNSGKGFYSYQAAMGEGTAGSYEAYFTCVTNTIDALNQSWKKYWKVKFVLDETDFGAGTVFIDNSSETDSFYKDDKNNIMNNLMKVESGTKLNADKYEWFNNTKIKWYLVPDNNVDNVEFNDANIFNFNDYRIKSDVTLYGKKDANFDDYDVVNAGINNFINSNSLKITSGNQIGSVINLDQAFNDTEPNLKKLEIGVKEIVVNGGNSVETLKMLLKENTYYEYIPKDAMGNYKISSLKLDEKADDGSVLGESGVFLENIYDIYKFIEIVKFKDELKLGESSTKYKIEGVEPERDFEVSYVEVVDGNPINRLHKCKKFAIQDKTTSNNLMTLYISNGKIYKTEIEGKLPNLIQYVPVVGVAETGSPSYLVRLYSNDENLNSEFEKINNDFNSLIKIVPGFGENVKTLLEDEEDKLYGILKGYDYTIYSGQDKCENMEGAGYNIEDIVEGHMKLCFKVKAKFENVEKAINELRKGGVEVSTKINIEGFGTTQPRNYYIKYSSSNMALEIDKELIDINDTNKLHPTVFNMLEKINKLPNEKVELGGYYKFKYENDQYKFYKSKNDSVAYLTITLKDSKIDTVVYYDGTNTYTTTFSYEQLEMMELINALGKGGFVLNKASNVESLSTSTYYDSIASLSDETIKSFYGIMKALIDDISNYSYDSDTKIFTKNNISYGLEINGGNITKIIYNDGVEETTYSMDYIKYQSVTSIKAFLNSAYDKFYLKDSSDEMYFIFVDMEGDAAFLMNGVKNIYDSLGDYEYVLEDSEYIYTKDSNTYKFKLDSNGNIESISLNDNKYIVIYEFNEVNSLLNDILGYYSSEDKLVIIQVGENRSYSFVNTGNALKDILPEEPETEDEKTIDFMKKIYDIRENPSNYEVLYEDKNILVKEGENIVLKYSDEESNWIYYEEGLEVGEIFVNPVIEE